MKPLPYDVVTSTCKHNYETTTCCRCENEECQRLYHILFAVIGLGGVLMGSYWILKNALE